MDELSRRIYELKFRNKFLELRAKAFQDFFCDIMEKKYKGDFMRCKSWGKRGDQKNDGYLRSKRTLFQIYAPDEMTEAGFKRKLNKDFNEAIPHWKKYFDTWIFVHNARDGLGPEQLRTLLNLNSDHPKVEVVHWGYENLKELLFSLEEQDIEYLLGPIFLIEPATAGTGQEITAPSSTFDVELKDVIQQIAVKKRKKLDKDVALLQNKAKEYFDVAEDHYQSHRFGKAAESYKASIKSAPTMSAHLNLGICYYKIYDYSSAKQALLMGLRIARRKKADMFEAVFLNAIGSVLEHKQELDQALNRYQQALEVSKQMHHPFSRAISLWNIGLFLQRRGQLGQALNHYRQALRAFKDSGCSLGQDQILNNVGVILRCEGKLNEALKLHNNLLKLHRSKRDLSGQANQLCNIGNILVRQGKLKEALNHYWNSWDLYQQIRNQEGQANTLCNIAFILTELGMLDDALKLQRESLRLHRRTKNQEGQANTLVNMGAILRCQGKLNKALKLREQALEIFQRIKDPLGQANALCNIGIVLSQQGKNKDALEKLHEGRDIYLKIGAKGEGLEIVENAIAELSREPE